MKVAVVGAGSTYTPELVVRALARARPPRRRPSSCCTTSTPRGSRSSAGSPTGCSRAQGFGGRLELTGDLDRALDGADAVLIQIRVGGQRGAAVRRDGAAACGCIGQETTGAGGLAKALRTVPVVLDIAAPRARAGRARRVDRRLHQPGRDRHPRAARRRPPRDRAVQRRHRLRARDGARCSASRPSASSSTRSASTTSRGCARCGSTARDVLARADRGATATRWPTMSSLPRRAARRARRRPLLLPALLLRARRGARRAARRRRRGPRRSREIERELLRLYRDPALDREAGAARAARRRVLQRGGDGAPRVAGRAATAAVHVVDVRNGGTLAGLAADDVVEVPARVDRDGAAPLPQRPLAPELLGLVAARRRLRAAGGRGRARRATRPTSAARCSPTRSSASGDRVERAARATRTPAGRRRRA